MSTENAPIGTPVECLVIACPNCGLPMLTNPHPDAGKPDRLNEVGAVLCCLPCAEKRANGRHRVIADLWRWIDDAIENEERSGFEDARKAFERTRNELKRLEDNRRLAFSESR